MLIERYSFEGFKPQKQTHHMKLVNYHLSGEALADLQSFQDPQKYWCEKIHYEHVDFYNKHIEDLKCGIWAFKVGKKNNLELNHLKRPTPCWLADLPDDTIVYNGNWDKTFTLKEAYGGFYIPNKELYKLKEIRKK